jgi:hypothetical protein
VFDESVYPNNLMNIYRSYGIPMRLHIACRSRGNLQRLPAARASADDAVTDSSFSLAKISFGDILSPLGVGLLVFGFGSYFQILPGSDISGVLLIYAFPIMLLGFALKYAQLEPVECKTTRAAMELRETQMTDNMKQVREDCTRFRCGSSFPGSAILGA